MSIGTSRGATVMTVTGMAGQRSALSLLSPHPERAAEKMRSNPRQKTGKKKEPCKRTVPFMYKTSILVKKLREERFKSSE
jgi:hypothetical protein